MTRIPICILESDDVIKYLSTRNLTKQYQKAKNLILSGFVEQTRFKLKEPKSDNIWYFRINKKYRAIGYFDENNILKVVDIDDHQ